MSDAIFVLTAGQKTIAQRQKANVYYNDKKRSLPFTFSLKNVYVVMYFIQIKYILLNIFLEIDSPDSIPCILLARIQ